jgi:hypothetical protein
MLSVIQYAEMNFVTALQQEFFKYYSKDLPQWIFLYAWCKQFEMEGCMCKESSFGHTCLADEIVQCVRETI